MPCVEKIKHDISTCESEGNSLQVFYDEIKGTYTGYCFSCAAKGLPAYVKDPYGKGGEPKDPPKTKTPEEIKAEIQEIRSCPLVNFDYRGIRKEFFQEAGVRLGLSEFDGKTPFTFNFPTSIESKLSGYKSVMLDKKAMWSVGDVKTAELLNWHKAKVVGGKTLYITEGQWDMLALHQVLHDSCGGKYKYAVTSIPNGVDSAAGTIGRMKKEIKQAGFEKIVLVFDNDKAGRKAVSDVQAIDPDVYVAPWICGSKDANDALLKGRGSKLADSVLWKSHKPLMEGVVSVADVLNSSLEPPQMGLSYPWPTITDATLGQHFGAADALGSAVGSGKTTLGHILAAHNLKVHGEGSALYYMEEANHKTLWNVAGKIDRLQYKNPEVFEANKDRYMDTVSSLEGQIFLWNSSGNSRQRFDMQAIVDAMRFNTLEYGIRFHQLDNMTKLVDNLSPAEANEFINKWSSELSNMAAELNINVLVYSHLNPPPKDKKSHEQGARVYLNQFTGSRGIMRSFSNIFGFERNQYSDTPDHSILANIKARDHGEKVRVKTQYDSNTGLIEENEWMGDEL